MFQTVHFIRMVSPCIQCNELVDRWKFQCFENGENITWHSCAAMCSNPPIYNSVTIQRHRCSPVRSLLPPSSGIPPTPTDPLSLLPWEPRRSRRRAKGADCSAASHRYQLNGDRNSWSGRNETKPCKNFKDCCWIATRQDYLTDKKIYYGGEKKEIGQAMGKAHRSGVPYKVPGPDTLFNGRVCTTVTPWLSGIGVEAGGRRLLPGRSR